MIEFDIITIFPRMFNGPLTESIIGKAVSRKQINITIHDLRDYTHDLHKVVDDAPYGGGPGMIMKPEPIVEAVTAIRDKYNNNKNINIVLMTPQGKLLDHSMVSSLAKIKHHVIICGHYGGIDERISQILNPQEISIGDYVLSGGELPAMIFVDSVARLVPGVVGCPGSVEKDCFVDGLLSYPQYTRPPKYKSIQVPEILLSGNHKKIERWRYKQALEKTRERRPDLFTKAKLSEKLIKILRELDDKSSK